MILPHVMKALPPTTKGTFGTIPMRSFRSPLSSAMGHNSQVSWRISCRVMSTRFRSFPHLRGCPQVAPIVSSGNSTSRRIPDARHFWLGRPSLYAGYSTTRRYTTQSKRGVSADDYIQELQDLYEIAKDELEIATESTDSLTIYAESDRATLREAFDDLAHAYDAYTGATSSSSPSPKGQSEGVQRGTALDSSDIPVDIREEIKRRVGQRIRELRNAVEVLEERSKSE
ncbi:hypothetical protein CIHG_08641 [Coccidioides immitis H538.4]|uniref:Uncharacterized protein n=1 Tax=Coccidioides immitis H538.4 TaxID=396776 RepID=A0A0J8S0Z9_COCIT|nr:hypothetical protein CIHG_08641 [Coccidioides immitis H538.4]